jgi:hypothetical protein
MIAAPIAKIFGHFKAMAFSTLIIRTAARRGRSFYR